MSIQQIEKNTLLVTPEGELDHHLAAKIRTAVDAKLGAAAKNIVFDFSQMSFMDSSGIGMIIGRYKKVQRLGGEVVIAAPRPQVKRIIKIAGLSEIIRVEPNVKRAVKKL